MGIFYGDLPVCGGSGKAEWDKIEGKPFDESRLETVCIYEYNDNLKYIFEQETSTERQSSMQNGLYCDTLVVGGQYILECNGIQYPAVATYSELTETEQEYYSSAIRISVDDNNQSFVFTQRIYKEEYGSEVKNSFGNSPDIVNTSGLKCWNCGEPAIKEEVNANYGYGTCCDGGTICTQEVYLVKLYAVREVKGKLYQECIPNHTHTLSDLPITISTTDLIDGDSFLTAGTLYFVYEE